MRIRIDLSYDGTGFHGWAVQPGLRTVQGELEAALATILRMPVVLTVAGRTDAGVHAAGQCAHFDVDEAAWQRLPGRSSRTPSESLVRKINAITSRAAQGPTGYTDVVVRSAEVVPDAFDARFSALWRRYSYRIADGVGHWDPRRRDVLWLAHELDVDAMNRAAAGLLENMISFPTASRAKAPQLCARSWNWGLCGKVAWSRALRRPMRFVIRRCARSWGP
ncbi:tRNA pseudouridine synthase A [Trueperella pyogenes]|uniref:tRNA pseudouridine synthase A n=1 Tax=Trueperella pyogenes TaxID=1661 RepID=UPI003DAA49FF